MKITIQVTQSLASALGNHKIEIDAPDGASISELLLILEETYPGFSHKLNNAGGRVPYNYFVNRKAVRPKEMETRKLRNGDRLHILVPVVGG